MAVSIRDKFTITVIILLASMSCRPKQEDFTGINMVQWRSDQQGCDGARMLSKDTFASQKDKILTLSEWEIVKVLGTPDRQELSKRNQKFYYYYLSRHKGFFVVDSSIVSARTGRVSTDQTLAEPARFPLRSIPCSVDQPESSPWRADQLPDPTRQV